MKNTHLLLLSLAFAGLNLTSIQAQNPEEKPDIKYRRSSLHTMILETGDFPRKSVVISAFEKAPFPDKYNEHTIGVKSFNPANYTISDEEKALIYKPSKLAKMAASSGELKIDSVSKELSYRIQKYLQQEKIANKMVAKWFNRQPDGSFDMSLIGERGSYSASDMEANIAKGSARGLSSLADAGEELIGNTFVIISKFNFVSNEIVAALARDLAKASAANISIPAAREAAMRAADAAYEKAKEGYSVWASSYLYKLVWNDSISSIFYNDMWVDKSKIDPKKVEAFDKSDLFKLEFIGDESATGLVMFSLKEKRSEDQIVEIATIRTIDAVYAKLQKKYDVFKPKVPLFTGYPITAKIGMKEGLEGGEKFDVLEQTMDPKTGLTKYVSKGSITVDKNLIWDNRYAAGTDPVVAEPLPEGATPAPVIDRTTFKGGKKFYSGMLIKQMK